MTLQHSVELLLSVSGVINWSFGSINVPQQHWPKSSKRTRKLRTFFKPSPSLNVFPVITISVHNSLEVNNSRNYWYGINLWTKKLTCSRIHMMYDVMKTWSLCACFCQEEVAQFHSSFRKNESWWEKRASSVRFWSLIVSKLAAPGVLNWTTHLYLWAWGQGNLQELPVLWECTFF